MQTLEKLDKLPKFCEFETKYRTEFKNLLPFKYLVESIPNHTFMYVQGPDHYYTSANRPFIRLRVGQYPGENGKTFMQMTSKSKNSDAKNNIQRREPNLNLTGNSQEEAENFIDMMGYKRNFSIWKSCHIYKFEDATVVFYTVKSDNGADNHFIEIEVTEENIHELTEEQAFNVIEKYESILESVGINSRKRLKMSLYDMYRRD